MVTTAIEDPEHVVRESALNAIGNAFEHRDLPLPLVAGLARCLPTMDPPLLEHALYILGSTRDPRARQMIAPYQQHSVDYVRESAAMSLAELPDPDTDRRPDRNS